jgi:hypothetical protein
MATAKSVTFEADKDTVFATTIQIIRDAGYIISETNDAARKIIYFADKPATAVWQTYRFEITITVSGASGFAADTAMFTMRTVGITNFGSAIAGDHFQQDVPFENELINFVINKLQSQYSVIADAVTISNAPGAGGQKTGCLVVLGFLGLLASGSGFACLMFLTNLFP